MSLKNTFSNPAILWLIVVCFSAKKMYAQTGTVVGKIVSAATQETIPFATAQVAGTTLGAVADADGRFYLKNVSQGSQNLIISAMGYTAKTTEVTISAYQTTAVTILLEEQKLNLNEVVVTATRTAQRSTDAPVIVNVISSKTLDQVVAINLAEGLKYQSGLRIETDCQTCNYTQLRINGLQGGYSQILINSRPIFSPLTGLYGLEQIPTNMIARIEVVRGGISALYGSSAIGGTVNVITKIPRESSYTISNTFQLIKGTATDNILAANATVINEKENAGATFFVNNRNREAYDANGDNFSELPMLKDNAFGVNLFYKPKENQKLSLSLSSINEYRYGGETVAGAAHMAMQSEERTHNIFMGSADYEVFFNGDKQSLVFYYGGQNTTRIHYTGIRPDGGEALTEFLAHPPYGDSKVFTHQGGIQFNNKIERFFIGYALLTVGAEYMYDDVRDEIESYNYLIDQTSTDLGLFVQQDWNMTKSINVLAGFRVDKHNLVDNIVVSPRLSVLYKLKNTTQFRVGWGTGFRAPQAFDTDMHIAFAGGGVSRISLAENLIAERANSFTASLNYDKATAHFIAGFTLEGFYTTLADAFFLYPLGADEIGERFEKRNGSGAIVQGITLEARANFDYKLEIEAGFTLQASTYKVAVAAIETLPAKREFLRTPNQYGYATLNYTLKKNWTFSANLVYTGTMEIAHFSGKGTGQVEDEYYTTPTFTELGFRLGHTFRFASTKTGLEVFGGIKNLLDAYQNDFDVSKNRDSNYVYGPSLPRTFFVGLKLMSL